jgi:hypothetical protein
MMGMTRARRIAAEAIGTTLLLGAVVGSDVMGERLAGGNVPGKLFEDRRRGPFDVGIMGKRIAAFADVDSAQLTGPRVHVAEKVTVNRL